MLRQRLITAVVGLPFLVALVWFGDPWFTAVWAVASGIGVWEVYTMARTAGWRPMRWFGLVWVLLFTVSPHFPDDNLLPILVSAAVILPLVWLAVRGDRGAAFVSWGWTLAGIFYVGWLARYWVALRILEDGRDWTIWGMFVVFGSDTFAYFVGQAFGKHLMVPSISPKKTWEGALGGVLGSLLASVLFGCILFPLLNYPEALFLGFIVSIVAQAGDLSGSLLKRNLGFKDSGRFLPGHGGIIDRFSSLNFAGVLVYYIVLVYPGLPF
ncbi:MAG: phosphatidate cytidylyltransferase [Dehalococcoidia bacterium]|nr:phosphatidate cytidylyltransferase [Dehalococcoidia bacterium]